ncbi:MAG: hypothetical protein HC887_13005 [Desulfobacteraceae bacterium]|nr:hypothetical protein [Desulfobacteraceae bacterium]
MDYGVSHYTGRLDEMSAAIDVLLARYRTERIIDMPYTLENFRHDVIREALGYMTSDEIMEKFPVDKLLQRVPLRNA